MNDSEFLSNALWSDLKTDMERANWFLLGRGYETGVVAKAIQNELAMAYSRLAFLSAAQPVEQEAEHVAWLVEGNGDSHLIRHSANFPGAFAGAEYKKTPLYAAPQPPMSAEPWEDGNGVIRTGVLPEPVSAEARMLRELLARIHRDGGHYVAQHGLNKAVEDADRIVSNLIQQQNLLDEVLEYLEDHADVVDGPDGKQLPNRAMILARELRQVQ